MGVVAIAAALFFSIIGGIPYDYTGHYPRSHDVLHVDDNNNPALYVDKEDVNMSSVNSTLCPARVLQWQPYAAHWSRQTGVPTALILAFIDQESDGRADSKRHEPEYMKKLISTKQGWNKLTKIQKDTGISFADAVTSYGLMQPLFTLAYGYGARSIEDISDPNKNIRYCSAHIATLAKNTTGRHTGKYSLNHIAEIAGRYNGAGTNSKYASDVVKLYTKYDSYLKGKG